MNKSLKIFLITVFLVVLTSCSKKNETADASPFNGQDITVGEGNQEINQINESISSTDESIVGSNQTENPDNPIVKSDCDYESLDVFFEFVDPKWNLSDEYKEGLEAYESIMADIYRIAGEKGFSSIPHFAVSYIDDKDDVPELLVSYGNSHPCGVCVYRYDPVHSKVLYLGEFGSFGRALFYERKNLIECYYGNHGCYTYYLSKIIDNSDQPVLIDSWVIDGSGISSEEITYFHGYIMDERINGSRESFEQNELNELYINADMSSGYYLTEEEFSEELPKWIGQSEDGATVVSYDDMYSVFYSE